jgi:hypothetical protein
MRTGLLVLVIVWPTLLFGQWASINNGQIEKKVLSLIGRPAETYECGIHQSTDSAFAKVVAPVCILTENKDGDFKFVAYTIPGQTANLYLTYNRVSRDFIVIGSAVETLAELSAEANKLGVPHRPQQPDSTPQLEIAAEHMYVLMVYEEEGIYTSVSASEGRAFADLAEYVKKNWSKAFPRVAPPDDDEQLIDAFFDRKDAKEDYEILELPLLK